MIYSSMILGLAKTIGVPGALLLAICTVESGGINVVRVHDGPSSTYGICQIKKSTAEFLGFKGSESDLMKPSKNVEYAARYLRYQLERYQNNTCKAVAAYNLGYYKPSTKRFGKPVNFGYIEKVMAVLEDKELLNCESGKVALE